MDYIGDFSEKIRKIAEIDVNSPAPMEMGWGKKQLSVCGSFWAAKTNRLLLGGRNGTKKPPHQTYFWYGGSIMWV